MSVIFKKIRWENFLSTGAAGNEIELTQYKTNLITGKNGSGKSTLLDALCFVLFGKPFRNINKNQLINSINGKQCVVTLDLTVSDKSYKIIRGIKPNIFEIWQDEELLNKEAASRDYQKILEQQILKFNYKTFTQTEVLGSASYTPFMMLSAASRREIIEDILDIGVFSLMNDILKQEYSLTKSSLVDVEYKIANSKEKILSQNKLIEALSESKESQIEEAKDKIKQLTERNLELNSEIDSIRVSVENLNSTINDYEEFVDRKEQAKTLITKSKTTNSKTNEELEFFENNDSCPTCQQNIEDGHKKVIIGKLKESAKSQHAKIDLLETALVKLNARLEVIKKIQEEIQTKNKDIFKYNNEVTYNNKEIQTLNKLILDKSSASDDIEKEKKELKLLAAQGLELVESKNLLLEEKAVKEQAILLLKDTGIKTSIIKEYLPIINRQINKYLGEMDFFCNFELDETFTEKIRSRGRDDFSYENFSEGEKQRIDIAIMLTFRYISKMKNSLNTNILILDEIFSSSLDKSAVDFLIDMLTNLTGTNVYVITHHGEQFIEVFDNHIQYEKRNEFSIKKENKDD